MGRETPWAFISGASGEIGQAIALALADQGVPLFLHYHQSGHKLEPVLQYCRERSVPAYPIQADLRDLTQIQTIFDMLPVKPLLLVNNSSVDHVGLFTDITPEQFEELVNINVRSAFFLTQAAVKPMIQQGYGRIVNLSSIWGLTGGSCEVLYSLTKGAINSFTKALAKELAPSGITVNAVAPGAVEGGMMRRFSPEEVEQISQEIPVGRMGLSTEVASLVSYLLSPQSGYVTGQIISPNGGWYT
ncbi:elongation factor P 5-aminopentanone reductase [Brevibacillus migulae]|uniref:elongation factor P 5-aminopentanone reductase n=1 Tax=Brevibacillus migulae TaxID=1644114 RepID=UPI00106DEAE0|nr:SDR family oxidoreductase [Brevibacillus migulae]